MKGLVIQKKITKPQKQKTQIPHLQEPWPSPIGVVFIMSQKGPSNSFEWVLLKTLKFSEQGCLLYPKPVYYDAHSLFQKEPVAIVKTMTNAITEI